MSHRRTGVLTNAQRLAAAWITLDAGPVIRTPARMGNHFRVLLTENARFGFVEPEMIRHLARRWTTAAPDRRRRSRID